MQGSNHTTINKPFLLFDQNNLAQLQESLPNINTEDQKNKDVIKKICDLDPKGEYQSFTLEEGEIGILVALAFTLELRDLRGKIITATTSKNKVSTPNLKDAEPHNDFKNIESISRFKATNTTPVEREQLDIEPKKDLGKTESTPNFKDKNIVPVRRGKLAISDHDDPKAKKKEKRKPLDPKIIYILITIAAIAGVTGITLITLYFTGMLNNNENNDNIENYTLPTYDAHPIFSYLTTHDSLRGSISENWNTTTPATAGILSNTIIENTSKNTTLGLGGS